VVRQDPGRFLGHIRFPIPGITAVRTKRYKYVEYQNDVRPRELFDLESDPKEMQNIIGTPAVWRKD
jgi:hypothetical protein